MKRGGVQENIKKMGGRGRGREKEEDEEEGEGKLG